MITQQTSGNATVVGMNSNKNFGLVANNKAFRILSSGIYKNKILAPIRELSTNAWDIHKQVGQTRPFEVTLPNSLEPNFKVRDFGTGLSKVEIMGDEDNDIPGIYTTYFLSTKEDTNDFVGCLGLGTKSPFAYTSSFTVTSYYGGKKSVYAMYLDGDTPAVNIVGEEDSDEPTGIEVSFGVNTWDFDTFRREVEKLYSFWNEEDRPVVKGQHVSYGNYLKGATKGDGWVLSDEKDSAVFTRNYFYVVMGNIPYKVYAYDAPNREFHDILEYSNLIFQCELGEVNFTASRETLELDKHTIDAIVSRIDDFKASILKSLEDQIDNCGSLWNARVLAYQFKNKHSLIRNHEFKYKGMDLNQNIDLKKTPLTLFLKRPEWKLHRKQVMTKMVLSDMVSTNEPIMFLYNDLDTTRHANSRINFMIRTKKVPHRIILIDGMSFRDAKRVFGLSKDQITRVSTLDVPPRKPRISKSRDFDVDEQIEFFNKHILRYNGYRFDDYVVPKGEAAYFYIDLNRQTPHYNDKEISELQGMVDFLNAYTGYDIDTVYGVRQGAKKLVDNSDAWLNIYEIFKFEFKKWLAVNPIEDYASKEYVKNNTLRGLEDIKKVLWLNDVTAKCDIVKRIEKVEADLAIPSNFTWELPYNKLRNVASEIGLVLKWADDTDSSAVAQTVADIKNDYEAEFPLMQYLRFYDNAKAEYLRLWVLDKENQALINTVQVSKV